MRIIIGFNCHGTHVQLNLVTVYKAGLGSPRFLAIAHMGDCYGQVPLFDANLYKVHAHNLEAVILLSPSGITWLHKHCL